MSKHLEINQVPEISCFFFFFFKKLKHINWSPVIPIWNFNSAPIDANEGKQAPKSGSMNLNSLSSELGLGKPLL